MSAKNSIVNTPLDKSNRVLLAICVALFALMMVGLGIQYVDSRSTGRILSGKVEAVSEMQKGDGTFDAPYVTIRLEGSNEKLECYFNAEEKCRIVQPGRTVTLNLNKLHGRIDSLVVH